jgi:hypothetical protein
MNHLLDFGRTRLIIVVGSRCLLRQFPPQVTVTRLIVVPDL